MAVNGTLAEESRGVWIVSDLAVLLASEVGALMAGFIAGTLLLLLPQLYVFLVALVFPQLPKVEPWKIKKPKQIHKTEEEMIKLDEILKSKYSPGQSNESMMWVNALLSRLWVDLFDSHVQPMVKAVIQSELDDLQKLIVGQLIKPPEILDVYAGNCSPTFSNGCILQSRSEGKQMIIGFDFNFEGGLQVAIATSIRAIKIPIKMLIHLKYFNGKLLLQFNKHPEHTIAFGFSAMPEFHVDVDCTLQGQNFPFMQVIVTQLLKWSLKSNFVLPKMKTKFLFRNNPAPIKEGYLLKRCKINLNAYRIVQMFLSRRWRLLWFSLTPTSLSYYYSHKDAKPISTLPLELIKSVHLAVSDQQEFALGMEVQGKGYIFIASTSREEALEWKRMIETAVSEKLSENAAAEDEEEILEILETMESDSRKLRLEKYNTKALQVLVDRLNEVNKTLKDLDQRRARIFPKFGMDTEVEESEESLESFKRSLLEAQQQLFSQIQSLDPILAEKYEGAL